MPERITLLMAKLRYFLHENKLILASIVLLLSVSIMVLSVIGIPDENGNEGTGPLAFLKGINIIIFGLSFIVAIVTGYIVYKYISDKNKFEALMRTDSQAIFRRNQIDIERYALRLTSKEEKRVLEAMKKYRIK
jgi:hypothetical protein